MHLTHFSKVCELSAIWTALWETSTFSILDDESKTKRHSAKQNKKKKNSSNEVRRVPSRCNIWRDRVQSPERSCYAKKVFPGKKKIVRFQNQYVLRALNARNLKITSFIAVSPLLTAQKRRAHETDSEGVSTYVPGKGSSVPLDFPTTSPPAPNTSSVPHPSEIRFRHLPSRDHLPSKRFFTPPVSKVFLHVALKPGSVKRPFKCL